MDKFIVKMFGINRFNFWGWAVTGMVFLFLIAGLLVFSLGALKKNIALAQYLALVAIAVALFGQFTLSLQEYSAKLAEKIERQNKDKV